MKVADHYSDQSALNNGALSGIRIIDFSRVLAGPYATMLLGDLGAEVIKIERPGSGDDTRGWGPPFDSEGRATYFQSVNRNKTGLVLDLAKKSDQERARELIATSDVLVENFVIGGMEKFGLGYEELAATNKKLIYCSISGFGSTPAARDLPGYDLLVQGMSGLMSITGADSEHPTKVGVAVIDVMAGLHATVGILAALNHRNQSGEGQKIEINLLSSALSGMVNQSGAYVGAGVIPTAMGNVHPSIAPYAVYQSKDQQIILAVGNDLQFAKFAAVLADSGLDLRNDSKFTKNQDRVKNRVALNEVIAPILLQENAQFWISHLGKVGVPVGPINNIVQAIELAEKLGLHPVISIEGSTSVANPITLSKTPVTYRLAPPELPKG